MPGLLVSFQNPVVCSHGGPAQPLPPAGRVTAMSFGIVTLAHTYAVTGCGLPAATSGAQPPCVAGMFQAGALRARSMSMPLAIVPALSICPPNPTPLIVAPAGQYRVRAT